jgi:hypothetical protein
MNRRLALTAGLCALLSARVAVAQSGVSIGYQGLPHQAAAETPNGIQIAEGVLMHVGAGAEAGYDSNVFYQNTGTISSGILRVSSFASIGNATRTSGAPAGLSFGAGAGLTYRRYTSDNPAVVPFRDAFMPNANLSLGLSSGQFAFTFADSFLRIEDAPYSPTQLPYARDINTASVEGRWSPGGGRITGTLRYTNTIDILEGAQLGYASSLAHALMLDASWKWLPKTAIFFQATQGYVTYLEAQAPATSGGKVSSYPLHVLAGLRGLITPKTSALLSLGYANGFYSSGATTNGILGSTYLQAQLTITPTLLSRIIVGAKHDFTNSVISNFYYDDSVYASYVQQLAGRFAVDLSGRYTLKRYEGYIVPVGGVPVTQPRTDNSLTLGATLDYFVRSWAYAGIGYSMVANFSDATIAGANGMNTSVNYLKHQVFARLGVTY